MSKTSNTQYWYGIPSSLFNGHNLMHPSAIKIIYIYGMNGTVILLCAGQFLPIWIDSKDGKCSRPLLHLTLMKFNYFQKKKRAIKWQAYSLRTIVRYTPTHLFPCYKKTCASSLICLGLHQPPVPNSYIHPLVESGKK